MLDVIFRRAVKPVQLRLRWLLSRLTDLRLGVTTTDEAVAKALGRDIWEYRRTWRALGWTGVWRLLHCLDLDRSDVLVDVGCGCGRVVCGAARRRVRRVIGIEIDPELARLAEANLRRLRGKQCPAEVAEVDATAYSLPEDATIVFLYNPFRGAVLDAVLDRIIASYDRSVRRLRLVYANPVEADRLERTGRVQLVDRRRLSWRPGRAWARSQMILVYEVVPAPDA